MFTFLYLYIGIPIIKQTYSSDLVIHSITSDSTLTTNIKYHNNT